MSPYKMVYWKVCHLLIELKHRAVWALKKLNLDLEKFGSRRKLQLQELEEFRLCAYENA